MPWSNPRTRRSRPPAQGPSRTAGAVDFRFENHASQVSDYIERELPDVLQEVGITPYVQRNQQTDAPRRPAKTLTPYQTYLAMIEPQKRLTFYMKSTTFLLSVCEQLGVYSLADHDRVQPDTDAPIPREEMIKKFEERQRTAEQRSCAFEWMTAVLRMIEDWAALKATEVLLNRHAMQERIKYLIRTIPALALKIWTDSRKAVPGESPIEKFVNIVDDDLSESTGNHLAVLLSSEEELQEILQFRGKDAQTFIDFLDEVSKKTPPEGQLNRYSERTLRRLCGRAGLLPASITLKESDIQRDSNIPATGGGFADVYEGTFEGAKVALKALRVYGRDNIKKVQKSFCREAAFWRRLVHPNITPFLGVVDSTALPLCMVSMWMENGNLATYLKNSTRANRLELLVDVATGLQYLHKQGIIHGDMKSANVLINEKLHACLSDFGLSSVTHDARTASMITTSSAMHGSIRWMAPELLHPSQFALDSERATAESDIYALAMTMLEAFSGNIPFADQSRDATVVIGVTLGMRPPRPGENSLDLGLSDSVWGLIEECWQTDWTQRPRVPAVLSRLEEAARLYVPPVMFFPRHGSGPSGLSFDTRRLERRDSEGSNGSDGGRFFGRDFTVPEKNLASAGLEASPRAPFTAMHTVDDTLEGLASLSLANLQEKPAGTAISCHSGDSSTNNDDIGSLAWDMVLEEPDFSYDF